MLYVASSWRNPFFDAVIQVLHAAKVNHYNFKAPGAGRNGFGWQEVMPSFDLHLQTAATTEYIAGLDHPRAVEGFAADFEAMELATRFLMVLPCGKSAHLELGWAIGRGLPTAILLDGEDTIQPELMYKMADQIFVNLGDVLEWLEVPN